MISGRQIPNYTTSHPTILKTRLLDSPTCAFCNFIMCIVLHTINNNLRYEEILAQKIQINNYKPNCLQYWEGNAYIGPHWLIIVELICLHNILLTQAIYSKLLVPSKAKHWKDLASGHTLQKLRSMRFEVLTAAWIKIKVFRNVVLHLVGLLCPWIRRTVQHPRRPKPSVTTCYDFLDCFSI